MIFNKECCLLLKTLTNVIIIEKVILTYKSIFATNSLDRKSKETKVAKEKNVKERKK